MHKSQQRTPIDYRLLFNQQRLLIEEYRAQGRELAAHIHELRQQLVHQERLNERARDYIDHVSHEFRTPLAVVNDYLAILQRGLAGPLSSEQQYLFEAISTHAGELNRMVEDILDVSRLEQGVITVRRRVSSTKQVYDQIRPIVERKAELARVQIQWDFPPDDTHARMFCDDEKVSRALTNLATNAIKFCGAPGQVKIQCEALPSSIRFAVYDNGTGIPVAELKNIFEKFRQHQVGSTYGSANRGFGLGLSIARELVELNFGEIHVESIPGTGSVFSFSVPTANPQPLFHAYVRYLSNQLAATAAMNVFRVTWGSNFRDAELILNSCLRRQDLLVPVADDNGLLITPQQTRHDVAARLLSIQQKWKRARLRQAIPNIGLDFLLSCKPSELPVRLGPKVLSFYSESSDAT